MNDYDEIEWADRVYLVIRYVNGWENLTYVECATADLVKATDMLKQMPKPEKPGVDYRVMESWDDGVKAMTQVYQNGEWKQIG